MSKLETIPQRNITAWAASAIVAGASAALIARMLWLLDRGFEFTDQSFYLMLAQRPAEYELTYGLFGYGLHPLYQLVGGSIACMQRAGALILVVFGAALGVIVSMKTKTNWRHPIGVQIVAVSASLPLAYYLPWIAMPGYNWFALVGGIALLIAMLLLSKTASGFGSAAMAAVAAMLVMLTRPQTALGYGALYLTAIFLIIPSGMARFTQVLRAACLTVVAAMGIAAILPIGTIDDQVSAYTAIFGWMHPLHFSFIDQQFEFLKSGWLLVISGAVFTAVLVSRYRGTPVSNGVTRLIYAVMAVIFVVTLLRTVLLHLDAYRIGPAAAIFAFCVLSLACLRKDTDIQLTALLGVAALIPWAATLGASGAVRPQLVYYSGLSSFIAFVGVSIAARKNTVAVTVASCVGLYMTFSAIGLGMASPYRLAAPIAMQIVPTRMGWGSELKLDSKTSEFITTLQKDSKEGGFCQGDMAIDLSGSLPGVVFAIGGHMPVFPWIFTGYPFSNHFAQEYLRRVGQARLARAWLITSETPNSFSMQELQSLGINFAAYRLVDDLRHPVDGTSVKLYAPLADRGRCEFVTNRLVD
jgi:hypothetical protein